VSRAGEVLRVRLARPEVHNALHAGLIAELTECLTAAGTEAGLRVLVLSGAGPSFCAGADLNWMRAVAGWTWEENVADATRVAAMFAALDECPVPTVARVHGAALGGGAGLLACCDVVVAAEDTVFGFGEAKLGLLPATIAPFVVAKIGQGHARALFATAARFDATRAQQIGLVHLVVPAAALDDAVQSQVAELLSSAPGAAAAARTLIRRVAGKPAADVAGYTAETIARLRLGAEGQEGMAAFLAKRPPSWRRPSPPLLSGESPPSSPPPGRGPGEPPPEASSPSPGGREA
jgi:methylglutaconyl-CoA hydratase